MRAEYFYGFILSFIGGVALEETLGLGEAFALLCVLLAVVLPLVGGVRSGRVKSYVVSFLFLGCALGIFRVDVSQMKQNAETLDRFVGQTVELRGLVITEPDEREAYTNIVLEPQRVFYDQGHEYVLDTPTRILVRVPQYPLFHYGDEVNVVGKVAVPNVVKDKTTGDVFDYRTYLAKDGIFYEMYFPTVGDVTHNKGNVILEKLFALKGVLVDNITRVIREPEASLAQGILLGVQQSLGTELLQKFRETGTAHIVVLSGYNIAVVVGAISRMTMFMSFMPRLAMSGLGVVLFAIMVGGGATVVRATTMTLLVLAMRALGREGDALRVLVLAGGAMVLVNPMILLHDVSFQFSFVATLALVVLVPLLEKHFLWVKNLMMREIFVATIATQCLVFPLILYYMGSVSLISIVANMFVLPVIPLAMFAVALVALFSWVPFVGHVFAFVASTLLVYVITAVEMFARVPFASLSNISFPLWLLVVTYVTIAYVIIKKSKVAEVTPSTHEF